MGNRIEKILKTPFFFVLFFLFPLLVAQESAGKALDVLRLNNDQLLELVQDNAPTFDAVPRTEENTEASTETIVSDVSAGNAILTENVQSQQSFVAPQTVLPLFWNNVESALSGQPYSFEVINLGDSLLLIWQEINESTTGKTFSIYYQRSTNLRTWSQRRVLIDQSPFNGIEDTSLFSVANIGNHVELIVQENRGTLSQYTSLDGGLSFDKNIINLDFTDVGLTPHVFSSQNDFSVFITGVNNTKNIEKGQPAYWFLENKIDKKGNWAKWQDFKSDNLDEFSIIGDFYYDAVANREYLISQNYKQTDNGGLYKLVLRQRRPGGRWSQIPLYDGYLNVEGQTYDDSQPSLFGDDTSLYVVWERRPQFLNIAGQVQTYYFRMSLRTLNFLNEPQPLSDPGSSSGFSKGFLYKNSPYFYWIDVLSSLNLSLTLPSYVDGGIEFDIQQLTFRNGVNKNPRSIIFKDTLVFFWLNEINNSNQSELLFLAEDTAVTPPLITYSNFTLGSATNQSEAIVRWKAPEDKAGIRRMLYKWSDKRQEVFPLNDEDIGDFLEAGITAESHFIAPEEGLYYLHIRIQDFTGNWSEPFAIPFNYDITAPVAPSIRLPPLDQNGFVFANTFRISWEMPYSDAPIKRFRYRLTALDAQNKLALDDEIPLFVSKNNFVDFNNINDGRWRFELASQDSAGNWSPYSWVDFQTNKFNIRTYVSAVFSELTETGRQKLSLQGRGFVQEDSIDEIFFSYDALGNDKVKSWKKEGTDYIITSDRRIDDFVIKTIPAGNYYLGVEHPTRGRAMYSSVLSFDEAGALKRGYFRSNTEKGRWGSFDLKVIQIVLFDNIFLFLFLLLLLLMFLITCYYFMRFLFTLYSYKKGLQKLLLTKQAPISYKEAIMQGQGKFVSIRTKLIVSFSSLSATSFLIIFIIFNLFLQVRQRTELYNNLNDKVNILLNNLEASSQDYFPSGDRLNLALIPNRISTLDEGLYITALGQNADNVNDVRSLDDGLLTTSNNLSHDYIWASNDPDISLKQKLPRSIDRFELENRVLNLSTPAELQLINNFYRLENNTYFLRASYPENKTEQLLNIFRRSSFFVVGQSQINERLNEKVNEVVEIVNTQYTADLANEIASVSSLSRELIEAANESNQREFDQVSFELSEVNRTISDYIKGNNRIYGFYSDTLEPLNSSTIRWNDFENTQVEYFIPVIYFTQGDDYFFKGSLRLGLTLLPLLESAQRTQNFLLIIFVIFLFFAIVISVVGAIYLSNVFLKPIAALVFGVEKIRDTPNKEDLKNHVINIDTRDEIQLLANTINEMTKGLVRAEIANKDLVLGQELQKLFLPLEEIGHNIKSSYAKLKIPQAEIFGYYAGAKGVSGDYFNFLQLGTDYIVVIKVDISGKGISAALIMIQVATLFKNFFDEMPVSEMNNLDIFKTTLSKFLDRTNKALFDTGFKNRFAAIILSVLNIRTGEILAANAGDNLVPIYRAKKHLIETIQLTSNPAAGIFSNEKIKQVIPKGFAEDKLRVEVGDILFFYTDGLVESQWLTSSLEETDENAEKSFDIVDEFGEERILDIIEAVRHKRNYVLEKKYNNDVLSYHFNFDSIEPTLENIVCAILANERLFRFYPQTIVSREDKIQIDQYLVEFMEKTFVEYHSFFTDKVNQIIDGQYVQFKNIREVPQYDDLSVLAVKRM